MKRSLIVFLMLGVQALTVASDQNPANGSVKNDKQISAVRSTDPISLDLTKIRVGKPPGRQVYQFFVATTMPATLEKTYLFILYNYLGCRPWLKYCHSRLPIAKAADSLTIHEKADFPWPINDRDLIYRVSLSKKIGLAELKKTKPGQQNVVLSKYTFAQSLPLSLRSIDWQKTKRLRIDVAAEPNLLPEHPDFIRVKIISGYWLLEDVGQGRIYVRYVMASDPEGWLPGWFQKLLLKRAPVKMMQILRENLAIWNGK